jgi:pimeloyl-ACP methyl ester carboxylesterase
MTIAALAPSTALVPAGPSWLDPTLYPFRTKRFATPDGAMSYVDVGSGPTVLLVHGTPSWSFEWRAVITALAGDHRVVAPDHLGFGLSDKPASAPLRPEDHAARLRALVEHLDLRDVTLVVHDFGCPIGLPLALETDRVARVVVLNGWMWSMADDPRVVRLDRVIRSWLGRFLYRWLAFSPRVILPSAMAAKPSPAVRRHFLGPFARREDRESTYAMALALRGSSAHYDRLYAMREKLAALPVALVWGMKDPAMEPALLDRFLAFLPNADVTRLSDVGHFPAEERPEAVVAAIRRLGGAR